MYDCYVKVKEYYSNRVIQRYSDLVIDTLQCIIIMSMNVQVEQFEQLTVGMQDTREKEISLNTPVKRRESEQQNTAESDHTLRIEDIDAQQLFVRFHDLVLVTCDNECLPAPKIGRRLNYDVDSSMKKKRSSVPFEVEAITLFKCEAEKQSKMSEEDIQKEREERERMSEEDSKEIVLIQGIHMEDEIRITPKHHGHSEEREDRLLRAAKKIMRHQNDDI